MMRKSGIKRLRKSRAVQMPPGGDDLALVQNVEMRGLSAAKYIFYMYIPKYIYILSLIHI